ncbi:MAG: hypothetical protein OEY19_00560 [Gammaproteobacteria bacterium]|nr:hypothetical protein [Gammaproteobacteria bacterium]MDH5628910.1 hypothetical protein [Gammaproteobacteria bacterium]
MKSQIVRIVPDPIDEDCLQITLKHFPDRFRFWQSRQPKFAIYKGYGSEWYYFPSFNPAPEKVVPFLREIASGSQFRHLRAKPLRLINSKI